MKEKKCRQCKDKFQPVKPLQFVCSPLCAHRYIQAQKAKKAKQESRKAKQAIKSRGKWLDEAQTQFNRYIRARDRKWYTDQGKDPECVSCGTTDSSIQFAAGHFKTRGGFPELRFHEDNVFLQCNRRCNLALSGNINGEMGTRGYRAGLLIRLGEEEGRRVIDWLDGPHDPKNYTIDDIKEIKAKYSKMARELERQA